MADSTDTAPRATSNRSTTPGSDSFKQYIQSNWADRTDALPPARDEAAFAAARRDRLSAKHPGKRLVIPAGPLKQRSNDTDYPFRAHTAFAYLTGWGSDSEPGSVLVLEPVGAASGATSAASGATSASDGTPSGTAGHTATLYFRERAGRDSDEFYANPEIGEFWIGPRPSLAQVASDLALETRGIAELDALVEAADENTLIVRDADPALTALLDEQRGRTPAALEAVAAIDAAAAHGASDDAAIEAEEAAEAIIAPTPAEPERIELDTVADRHADSDLLERDLSELRLVKDAWEIAQMRLAIAATARGFDDIIADLPRITAHERGERIVEGVFNGRARLDGNTVGYDTIAASGPHACILHWTRNDGPVREGDLILVDAGVELDSYYTADITRTLPVGGTFSPEQRMIYEAVREAADAAFAIVRPGIRFREIHATAMAVIAQKTAEWGLLPVSADEAIQPENQQHRRYMVHGTSHHLGLDVHDCAKARRELYLDGVLEEGFVFTIEPGLYFQPDDQTVPAAFRGIGVRIEDDILVTASGAENLSIGIPRTADDVEAWVARR